MENPFRHIAPLYVEKGWTLKKYIDNIFVIEWEDFTHVDLEMAKRITHKIGEANKGKKSGQLFIPHNFVSLANETRKYSASKEGQQFSIAEAYMVRNMGHQILGELYLKIDRPPTPTRLFRNSETALLWLEDKVNNYYSKIRK